MEKRLLFAVALSFIVLSLWSSLLPKRSNTDIPQNNAFLSQEAKLITNTSVPQDAPHKINSVSAQTNTIESDKLRLTFSDRGGSLEHIYVKDLDIDLFLQDILSFQNIRNKDFRLDRVDNNGITYSYKAENNITKSYYFGEDPHLVQTKINVTNTSNAPQSTETIAFNIYSKDQYSDKNTWNRRHAREQSIYEYTINAVSGILRKNNAYKFADKENKEANEKINWVGFRTQYACVIVKPLFETNGYKVQKIDDHSLDLSFKPAKSILAPGESAEFSGVIYIGPENSKTLKTYGYDFEKIKRFYRFWLFDAVAKLIYWLLHSFYQVIPNWGVCIIIISVIIYFSTYPLTRQSMLSMRKMQAFQPKINALREKYKNNAEKLNKEMITIYKENKINPLGGCLPVLLQMPVFIGLYQVLWRDSSFKGAGFLWINDLSLPDHLVKGIFGTGMDLNILPILMAIIMFFQQRITSRNMVFSTPEQETQQKMMANIMPPFLMVIFYQFASGLNLYFTMFYLFSLFTQWKMSKEPTV
jgi:YidC/Oxa1 family membrane protein insertase